MSTHGYQLNSPARPDLFSCQSRNHSGFAVPLDLDKIAFLGISKLQAALEGVVQRFADCMRQVNIRCLNDDRIRLLFNPHDAVLGMLSILFPLTVPNQIKQF